MSGAIAPRGEVLRYLRHRGGEPDEAMLNLVDEGMAAIRGTARPRSVWRVFAVERQDGAVFLPGCNLALPGADIARHLQGCGQAALLAATLGAEADRLLQAEPDITRAVILDAAANQYIEEICDTACAEIAGAEEAMGNSLTARFSPGYGNLPLVLQPRILAILDALRRIGLTATNTHLLIPQKSITAILGLGNGTPSTTKTKCDTCNLQRNCNMAAWNR